MPAIPNPAKVANKAAAVQMLMAVALECEYQWSPLLLNRELWLNDYAQEERESEDNLELLDAQADYNSGYESWVGEDMDYYDTHYGIV